MLMLHRKWLMLIGSPERLCFFKTKYKDKINGRAVSTNELCVNNVNENMKVKTHI